MGFHPRAPATWSRSSTNPDSPRQDEMTPGENARTRQARAVIERVVREGRVLGKDGTTHEIFPVAITREEGEAVRDWVAREQAQSTIEVGLGYGVAALFICEGLLTTGSACARHLD